MSATTKLIALAKKIEGKLIIAQTVSAQPSDVEMALRSANLFDISNQVAPLLNKAGVPETASLKIDLAVDPHLNVSFLVKSTPPHASANILAHLLKNTYGTKMKAALQASNLTVAGQLEVGWLNF